MTLSMQTISPVSFAVEQPSPLSALQLSSQDENEPEHEPEPEHQHDSLPSACPCSGGASHTHDANGQPTPSTIDRVLEHYHAMRHQERTTYHVPSTLYHDDSSSASSSKPVDAACRSKMCTWCYQVVDYCGFQRGTVEVAMSLLDRFLASSLSSSSSSSSSTSSSRTARKCRANRQAYQLAAMTALYTAIKVQEPAVFDPAIVASLGRGALTEEQVVAMELRLLDGVKWHVAHPTAAGLVYQLMDLLPHQGNSTHHAQLKAALLTLALHQTELAVSDADLASVPSSAVAVSAVLNALHVVEERWLIDRDQAAAFRHHLATVTGGFEFELDLEDVRDRIVELPVDEAAVEGALSSLQKSSSTTTTISTASFSPPSSSSPAEQDEIMAGQDQPIYGEPVQCDYVMELKDAPATSTSTSSFRHRTSKTKAKRRGSADSLDSLASAASVGSAGTVRSLESPVCVVHGAARQTARYARHNSR